MKVLVITNLCSTYTATLPDRSLYRGLVAKGVDLTVISPYRTPESQELESSEINVLYIPITKKIDLPAILKLRKIIIEEKYDILHLTNSKAITNGLIASWGTGIKIIAYLGSLSIFWHDPSAYMSFLNSRIDKVICVSNATVEHLLKQARRKLTGKTVRIYKGFDPDWIKDFKPVKRESLQIPENAFVICCVANVRKIKGIDYLIKASNYVQDNLPIYFLLIGLGMDSGFIRRLINKTKYSPNFRTIGSTKEVFSYISICDIYIQPSLCEGLGRSITEAMVLSKPVIVTDKGGAKELVVEGESGYIIPVKSAEAIADKINKCFENRHRLPEMGQNSRERIKTNFNPQATIDQTFELYCELVDKKDS
jgi:L-malate glycosyltransferase